MPLGAVIANFLNNYQEPAELTFWTPDPVAWTPDPVAFVPVGPDDTPPWN